MEKILKALKIMSYIGIFILITMLIYFYGIH